MALRSFPDLVKRLFDTHKKRRWFSLFIIIIVFLLLIKACFHEGMIVHPYKIAFDPDWGQINLMEKGRNISAFSRVLLSEVGMIEKKRISLIQTNSGGDLLAGLYDHEYDGILTSLQPSPINQATLLFSDVYFKLGSVLVVRAGSPVKGWNELTRKIVGVQANSPNILDLEKDSTIQIKLYDNILNALSDLDKSNIDGVLFPALQAYVYATTFYAGKLKIVTAPLTDEGLRLVALNTPDGKELIDEFNDGLKIIKENGTYDFILNNWGLFDTDKVAQPKIIPPTET